ncbi:hypothetical protein YWS52_25870 [Chitiniphilus shinanonensis]
MPVDPFLVQVNGAGAWVLVNPRTIVSQKKYGNPCPPFILQDINGSAVDNRSARDLPDMYRFVNVIVEPRTKGVLDRIKKEKYISFELVREINSKITANRLMVLDYSYCY